MVQVLVPIFFIVIATKAVVPAVIVVGGGVCEMYCALLTSGLATVTLTMADAALLPAASRAAARSKCVPLANAVVSQAIA